MTAPVRVALLGLGEAGSELARDLVSAGADVRGFDPVAAVPAGVAARSSDSDAVRDADLVLSVNSASDALPALLDAIPSLRPGTIWADLNTTAPSTKAALVAALEGRQIDVVDVALLAPVPGSGLRTPMLASGEGAAGYAQILASFGIHVEILPGPAGAAISRKLLRSVYYKGLAAAVVEATTAARAAGCEDWLRASITADFCGFDERTLDRLIDGTHRHALRRTEEMTAAARQLTELGIEPRVSGAARDLLSDLCPRGDKRTQE
jgi:3-hydroxyisobutyrate dehydrogenase-like beta-hydroxyacid dehydrogenase